MIVKISRASVDAGEMEKLKSWLSKEWQPLIRHQRGLARFFVLAKDSGEFAVITLWDNGESMESWNNNVEHKKIVKTLLPLLTSELSSEVYNRIEFDS